MLRCRVGAAVLLLVGLAASAPAQTTIEWKLKKGDQFYLRNVTTTKQTLKATVGTTSKDYPQNSEQTIVLGFRVEDEVPEGYLVKEAIEDATVKPEKGEPVRDEKLVGTSFTITLSKKWEILKFEGYEKLIEKLAGDDAAARQVLQATLSEDALKKSVREVFAFLPDRPVKDGDKWERTVEEPFGALGTLTETRLYKLEGKEDLAGKKVDKISFTTSVEFKAGKKVEALPYYVSGGRMEAKDAKGTVYFDPATGQLVQIKSEMKLSGTMQMVSAENKIDATVQQEQNTVLTLLLTKPEKK